MIMLAPTLVLFGVVWLPSLTAASLAAEGLSARYPTGT